MTRPDLGLGPRMLNRLIHRAGRAGPGRLMVTITFLEMLAAPGGEPVPAPRSAPRVVRSDPPTASYYRWLYTAVGEPWLWHERRMMSDDELLGIVADERVEVLVAQVGGTPAGYAELDRRERDRVNLAYFGLMPEFIGRGLGRWFLDRVIRAGWTGDTRRLTVNTCTFDHPRALPLYRSLGFIPYRETTREVWDPRVRGPLPRTAAPHIPIID